MATRSIPLTLFMIAAALTASPAVAGAPPPDEGTALLREGRAREGLALYDEAAERYEAFARERPKAEEAPTALTDAVALRLGLGQTEQAIKDADLFSRNYGSKQPERTTTLALAIAGHLVDREDYASAKKRLEAGMALFDRSAVASDPILAHAWLGRTYQHLDDPKRAEAEFTKVRALWKDPARIVATFGQDSEGNRRLARALTAVGEALFFFAEQKRVAADAIRFPVYKGPADTDSVRRHMTTGVAEWVKKKRPAIEEAAKAYVAVTELQPYPPPKWVVASSSRVGGMWGKFAAEFRAAPIPREWRGEGTLPASSLTYPELRAAYYRALDEAVEPHKQQAKGAFRSCLSYSVKYQYFDAFSERCQRWLMKSYPLEFPVIEEIFPRSRLLGDALPPGAPVPEPG